MRFAAGGSETVAWRFRRGVYDESLLVLSRSLPSFHPAFQKGTVSSARTARNHPLDRDCLWNPAESAVLSVLASRNIGQGVGERQRLTFTDCNGKTRHGHSNRAMAVGQFGEF